MLKRSLLLAMMASLCTSLLWSQGLDTDANKDDWEEVNFEFDSSILTDGYPSLLRLAELLSEQPDYKVTLEGNTDFRGPDAYNQGLGQRRAETVRRCCMSSDPRTERARPCARPIARQGQGAKTLRGADGCRR